MAFGYGGTSDDCGYYPNVFFPSFILFLVLILLVFGMGFWALGAGALSVEE